MEGGRSRGAWLGGGGELLVAVEKWEATAVGGGWGEGRERGSGDVRC